MPIAKNDAARVAIREHVQRQQRVPGPSLLREEQRKHQHAGAEHFDREVVAPARGLRVREPEHECEQAVGDHERAGDVEPRPRPGPRVVHERQRACDRDQREHEVDVHAKAPGQRLGQDAAEQQPDRSARAGDRREHAECPGALGAVGERRGQERQSRRSEQGAERALERAGRSQHSERLGRAAKRGRDRET
jgi:hypothetical protein